MSRYPTFEGPNPSYPYDRNLLAHAPIVTRADRQAGYDIGIIERGVVPPAPAPAPALSRRPNPFSDTPTNRFDKELPSHPKAEYEYTPSLVSSYTYRWYKTKRGIAIIVLIALIIISIIVGVAVGVSGEKQNQSALAAATEPAAVDPSTSRTATPASTPPSIPSTTPPTTTNRPLSTLVPVTSTPAPSSPAVPLITHPTGTPQTALPSTSAPSAAPSASVSAGQGGNEGQQNKPWICKLLPIFC